MSSGSLSLGLTAVWAAALVGVAGYNIAYMASPNKTGEITVDSKERGRESAPDLVYTTNGTYKVGDSWTRGVFRSADTYGMLREGCTYRTTHYGFRVGLLSSFPNVVAAEHVPTAACPTNGGMPARSPRR